jgi:hypothetical protein
MDSSLVPVGLGLDAVPGVGDHSFELRLLGLLAELGPDLVAGEATPSGIARLYPFERLSRTTVSCPASTSW